MSLFTPSRNFCDIELLVGYTRCERVYAGRLRPHPREGGRGGTASARPAVAWGAGGFGAEAPTASPPTNVMDVCMCVLVEVVIVCICLYVCACMSARARVYRCSGLHCDLHSCLRGLGQVRIEGLTARVCIGTGHLTRSLCDVYMCSAVSISLASKTNCSYDQ